MSERRVHQRRTGAEDTRAMADRIERRGHPFDRRISPVTAILLRQEAHRLEEDESEIERLAAEMHAEAMAR